MGSNANDNISQAGSEILASPSEGTRATQPLEELGKQPVAVPQLQAEPAPPIESSDARLGSSPSREPAFTEEQGLQEAQLQPLQDTDLVVDFSLPPPQSIPNSAESSVGHSLGPLQADSSREAQHARSLPDSVAATESYRSPATSVSRSSPFALGQSTDGPSSSAQQAPAEGGKHAQADPEVPAHSSLQPATPPLHTPAGQTPASRPASEQEGEPTPSAALRQGSLQGIAKGIQAAIERKLRYIPSYMSGLGNLLATAGVDAHTGLGCVVASHVRTRCGAAKGSF